MSDYTDHWRIAYRELGQREFHAVSNPRWAWAADPFLVEYENEIYLFAELFLYASERNGVIGYCKWENGKFGEWIVSMDKHWHLSYPYVWVEDGMIHMIPESYQKNDVSHYVLKEFPNKWERVDVLIDNCMYVDTTILNSGREDFLFTFQPSFSGNGGCLLLYRKNHNNWKLYNQITSDCSMARPGGKFFTKNGKLIRVAQNCVESYGAGLTFLEVDEMSPNYREHVIKSIFPRDIPLDDELQGKNYTGVHTYNQVAGLEVIDLKYQEDLPEEHEAQRNVRKVFLNKYDVKGYIQ